MKPLKAENTTKKPKVSDWAERLSAALLCGPELFRGENKVVGPKYSEGTSNSAGEEREKTGT